MPSLTELTAAWFTEHYQVRIDLDRNPEDVDRQLAAAAAVFAPVPPHHRRLRVDVHGRGTDAAALARRLFTDPLARRLSLRLHSPGAADALCLPDDAPGRVKDLQLLAVPPVRRLVSSLETLESVHVQGTTAAEPEDEDGRGSAPLPLLLLHTVRIDRLNGRDVAAWSALTFYATHVMVGRGRRDAALPWTEAVVRSWPRCRSLALDLGRGLDRDGVRDVLHRCLHHRGGSLCDLYLIVRGPGLWPLPPPPPAWRAQCRVSVRVVEANQSLAAVAASGDTVWQTMASGDFRAWAGGATGIR